MAESRPLSRVRTYPVRKLDAVVLSRKRVRINVDDDTRPGEGHLHSTHGNAHKRNHGDGHTVDKETNITAVHKRIRMLQCDSGNTEAYVTGHVKKRTPKKIKRTDSYKLATNRRQSLDDLDDKIGSVVPKPSTEHARTSSSTQVTKFKSQTMPCKFDSNYSNKELGFTKKKGKGIESVDDKYQKRHISADTEPRVIYPEFSDNVDEVEEQCSVPKERKKKSVFKIMKERLFQTFTRKGKVGKPVPAEGKSHGFHHNSNSFTGSHVENSILKLGVGESDDELHASSIDLHTTQNVLHSEPLDIPIHGHLTGTRDHIDTSENLEKENITDIFGSLIDPSTPFLTLQRYSGPDRSRLTLEGLQKYRPKSLERKDKKYEGKRRKRGESAEFSDTSDEPQSGELAYSSTPEFSPFEDYMVASEFSCHRRLHEFGRRLSAVGDRLVAERASDLFDTDGQQSTSLEELVQNLKIAVDMENHDLVSQSRVNSSIVSRIKKLATAPDYSRFKQVVVRELSTTVQWEQVAWYTYLIKTTMCVVGTGKALGQRVQGHATRYFNTHIRPWIESRPNGWESIYAETDIEDSELD